MQPISAALLLGGRDTVASAREKILDSPFTHVVVQRINGRVLFWYILPRENVLADFKPEADEDSVEQALGLEHFNAASVVQDINDMNDSVVTSDTVVLDGSQFIGIRLVDAPHLPKLADPVRRSGLRPQTVRRGGRSISFISHELSVTVNPLQSFGLQKLETLSEDTFVSMQIDSPVTTTAAKAFQAYPRLDAPDVVSPGQRFNLSIGLAGSADPNTSGAPFTLQQTTAAGHIQLDVLVIADGFTLPEGGRRTLDIDCAAPWDATIQIPVIAPARIDDTVLATMRVIYFFEHVPCGSAARKISVISSAAPASNATQANGQLWQSGPVVPGSVTIEPGLSGIDLIVFISKMGARATPGWFEWTFYSPHAVALPAVPIPRDYGVEGKNLGTLLNDSIPDSEKQDMVELTVGGIGKTIADRMPGEFWSLLNQVAPFVTPGQQPTLLFICAETYMPWELALVETPLDTNAPPYLGCQTNMSRWPLSDSGKPSLPPAGEVDIDQFAVVTGNYAGSSLNPLVHAIQEAETLSALYNAIPLMARSADIKQLLGAQIPNRGGTTGVQAVHFACHGEAIQDQAINAAILLEKDQRMSPLWLSNSQLGKQDRPFMFLNACQVGRTGELLGGLSGFAGQSLLGGFRGFIAPLWAVNDVIAHDIAVAFYERAFGNPPHGPQPVASILRELRQPFAHDKTSATRLAYVFFGHPALTLRRL